MIFQNLNIKIITLKHALFVKDNAYTLIEVTGEVAPEVADQIAAIDDVIRVRVIEAAK